MTVTCMTGSHDIYTTETYRPEHVVVKAVVAGQSNETSPTVGQGEEYLNGRVVPNLE